jgi:hypothetical protein
MRRTDPSRQRRRRTAARLQQLLLAQEGQQAIERVGIELQRGVAVDFVDDGLWIPQFPAAQHFKAGPVELEEQVAHRIVQRPAGLAVGQPRAGIDGQLLAQHGQAKLHAASFYSAMNWRMLASGRRSIQ